jgi:drug/metabolite transporter (DMT)-like permease
MMLPVAWNALDVPAQSLLMIGAMGIVQLGVPYALFIRGLQTVPATDATLILLVEPILNPVWTWLAIREVPHWSTLVGGALIMLALGVRFAGPRRRAAASSPG